MKIVMTLAVRNEADVVERQLRYHLDAGVDFVLATDHLSDDGTTEILRAFERDGVLRAIRRSDPAFRQREWVTEMARLAATEHAADWVINSDADEFWWPREASLREIFAEVPPRFGAVRGLWRNFALRPDDGAPFYERMTVRRRSEREQTSPYHPQVKVAHRGSSDVLVSEGNHDAAGAGLVLLREWFPFEILHFPLRTVEQLRRKYLTAQASHALDETEPVPLLVDAIARDLRTSEEEVVRRYVVDERALRQGLADGSLAIDTRLADRIAGRVVPRPTVADDVALAEEIDLLFETDALVRLTQRMDAVERRVQRIESVRTLNIQIGA